MKDYNFKELLGNNGIHVHEDKIIESIYVDLSTLVDDVEYYITKYANSRKQKRILEYCGTNVQRRRLMKILLCCLSIQGTKSFISDIMNTEELEIEGDVFYLLHNDNLLCLNCYNCYSCSFCIGCIDCRKLKRCIKCVEVINSTNTKKSIRCNKLINCENCNDCYYLRECNNCFNTDDTTYSEWLRNCNNCYKSNHCTNCNNCRFCFNCRNLKNKDHISDVTCELFTVEKLTEKAIVECNCPVCLEDKKCLTICKNHHNICPTCVVAWYKNSDNCPMCREKMIIV